MKKVVVGIAVIVVLVLTGIGAWYSLTLQKLMLLKQDRSV
jgi:uncharacterized protein YxeA